MYELKKIKKEAVPRALKKVEQYRLLNDPVEAESICLDILSIEPDNQVAIVELILTLTDQFDAGLSSKEALNYVNKLDDEYKRSYYKGIVFERQAKATLNKGMMDFKYDAFEWLEDAMEAFDEASKHATSENDDAVLRWNACARTIKKHNLTARPPETSDRLNLPLE